MGFIHFSGVVLRKAAFFLLQLGREFSCLSASLVIFMRLPANQSPLLLTVFLCLLMSGLLPAQVRVHLKMQKAEFVAHEQVVAIVTITNHAGRDLFLHSEGRLSWLDFSVKNQRGVTLSPFRNSAGIQAAKLPAGQSISKKIDLNSIYSVSDMGRYRVSATVRLPGGDGALFTSNPDSFNVTKARALYSQRVGVPGSKDVREYRVMSFNQNSKSMLYVQVEDVSRGRVLQTYSLGEALMFRQPKATVDGKNNLHVLYLVSPTLFARSQINTEGKFLGRDFYKRGATGSPRLVTFANGEVKVQGGIAHDPNRPKVIRQQIKKVTDRPNIAY